MITDIKARPPVGPTDPFCWKSRTMRLAASASVFCLPVLFGCASPPNEPPGPPAKESVVALTTQHELIRFNAGRPGQLLSSTPLSGLPAHERLVGLDFRVARGELFALGRLGQLYRIDVAKASAMPVGAPIAVELRGQRFGFDFNPTVDRIRVVSDAAQNLRLHPDTGAAVDADPKADGMQTDGTLAYDAADANAGRAPAIVAAAYTYNPDNDKITTNYAIDARQGVLVTQGSREGAQPAVSPNTGRLFTVGPLGTGAFEHADFDISDVKNVAYAALTPAGGTSVFYRIDLATGAATRIGSVGGKTLVGMAIEP
jgi:hypothetical protein